MVRRILNRLIGRTDSHVDAVNAYVEGNASADETRLVEQMMHENPALENDLATQQSLLAVLGRVEKIEAPRAFAVTPEMVIAAEGSESFISKLAELFAPQRKLAMAPAVLAGLAALTVALLTIGDIAGVVEQSSSRDAISTITVSKVEVASEAAISSEFTESVDSAVVAGASSAADTASDQELAVDSESTDDATSGDGSAEIAAAPKAPAATPAPAIAAQERGSSAPEIESAPADVAEGTSVEAPSLSTAASEAAEPAELSKDEPDASSLEKAPKEIKGDTVVVEGELSKSAESDIQSESAELVDVATIDGDALVAEGAAEGAAGGAAKGAAKGAAEGIAAGAAEGIGGGIDEGIARDAGPSAGVEAGGGISLPLRQLQIALAALAVAVVGAWAGLRRVRGE